MNATLFLRSLAYLRPGQVTYRALRWVQYRCYRAVPQLTARWLALDRAPQASPHAVETIRKLFETSFLHLNRPLKEDDKRIADLLSGRFTYLNQTLELKKVDWNARSISHLWNYQLHYFGFSVWCARALLELGDKRAMRRCQELIENWIETARIGHSDGWDAYPISLRVVNWIYAYALLAGRYDDHRFLELWRSSIYRQLDFLSRHVEYHLLANHLIKNAKALAIGGLFFAGDPSGAKWLAQGEKLLWRELEEQVLEDGGHYERSPMYHAIALEDLLDLVALSRVFPAVLPENLVGKWSHTISRMLRWLAAMTHPDGNIALFNDAAFGVAPRLADLEAMARTLGIEFDTQPKETLHPLPDSGYVRLQQAAAVMIADVGPIGPDYQPGHAHADTLGFELSVHGRRVFVDAGTSRYDVTPERLWQRGTSAHNTVQVNGQDSSEVWSNFRVARRARPRDVAWGEENEIVWLHGAHDGYKRLSGRPVHHREWRLSPHGLKVIDCVEGRFHEAVARFRLHPSLSVQHNSERTGVIAGEGFRLSWRAERAASVRATESTWHPAFGVSQPCRVLEIVLAGPRLETEFHWA